MGIVDDVEEVPLFAFKDKKILLVELQLIETTHKKDLSLRKILKGYPTNHKRKTGSLSQRNLQVRHLPGSLTVFTILEETRCRKQ